MSLHRATECAVSVENVAHRYGASEALRGVTWTVGRGEIFALLGPNGGGKTTLFRILATAIVPSSGEARILGFDVVRESSEVRRRLGVVFQSPSIDKKLTVAENLRHHGHLYGLRGRALRDRILEMLTRIGLADRANDRAERLSGGMQRRVEVAKCLLHRPPLMLMDEPSTGLDPGARHDLWDYLRQVREQEGLTILLTTHLMDEAEQCDRVAILNRGSLVAIGKPSDLAAEIGHEVVTLSARAPRALADGLQSRLQLAATVDDQSVRFEHPEAHTVVPRLFEWFGDEIRAVTVRRPSLEDVFLIRTGHRFWEEDQNS